MMNHETCREHLIDDHFDELALATSREVTEHLSTCADCALEFCRLRADLEGLTPPVSAPSAQSRRALRAEVQKAFPPKLFVRVTRLFSARVPLYQPAMALVLIVAVVALVWPRDESPQTIAPTTVLEGYDATNVDVVDQRIL